MSMIKQLSFVMMLGVAVVSMQGCSPEVGTKAWCEELKEKPKGDWTANEAKDFAKHCIL
ncbi:DUF3012 domain-containing protein [Amphritea sp.]|uniref:DUF3012 domain-containing protein n=1 Tax=Amphritea sp. TaxID=1872502 RepID=UPI003D0F66AE